MSLSSKNKAVLLLLTASIVWGVSYPMNRQALLSVEPFAFAAFRYLFGALALLPCALRIGRRRPAGYYGNVSPRLWLYGGVCAGTLLTLGTGLQYYGLTITTAGKSGFITSLYVSMVPLIGFVLGQIPAKMVWPGLGVSLIGLSIISGSGGEAGFNRGDALTLSADLLWASHVFVLGHFASRCNPWRFVTAQAAWCCVLSFALTYLTDTMCDWSQAKAAMPFMLWGVMAVGVAYVFQSIAQVSLPPTTTALTMQFQSVLAAAAGAVFLNEPITLRLCLGAVLLVSGAVIGQRAGDSWRMSPDNPRFTLFRYLRLGTALGLLSLCALVLVLT